MRKEQSLAAEAKPVATILLDHPLHGKLHETLHTFDRVDQVVTARTSMAKAPLASAKKGKDDKSASKSRSSASEVKKEKSKSKDVAGTASKKPSSISAKGAAASSSNDSSAAPAKSVLKESRPVPSFNLVQEQDFPRGAPPASSKAGKATNVQYAQEKGLFDVCFYSLAHARITS